MSKREALIGLLFESKLTIYELVSIINQMTGKCKGHASICIFQPMDAPKSKASLWRTCGEIRILFMTCSPLDFLSLFYRRPGKWASRCA